MLLHTVGRSGRAVELRHVSLADGEAIVLVGDGGGSRVLRRIRSLTPEGGDVSIDWSVDVGEVPGDLLYRAGDLVLLPVRVAEGEVATAAYAIRTGERRFLAAHPRGARGFRPDVYVARRADAARVIEVLPYATPELRALAPDTGAELWRVPLPGAPRSPDLDRSGGESGGGPVGLRVIGGALQVDSADGRTVHRVALADGHAARLGGPDTIAVCPLDRAIVALDRAGFLTVAPLDGGVPTRLARPGVGALPACASVGRRLYVVFRADASGEASAADDGRAIEDPFLPIDAGSALLAFDAGRFAFGRAFAWGDVVAPFTRPDTPSAPPPPEVVDVGVRSRERVTRARASGGSTAPSRTYRVDLASGRFDRAATGPEPPDR
jgi:hypothetical protein